MKVLMINGSPRINGNTSHALNELKGIFEAEGIETETLQVGTEALRGCIACNACLSTGKCVYDDIVNKAASILENCDGLVVASPVYYASANGTLISFLDRLFYSTNFDKTMKVGASIAVARRGGCSATYDELNKYFTISAMPVAAGTYWNQVHGFKAEDVKKDLEGLQTLRNLARNMAFLIKAFADAKEKYGLPEMERGSFTSFSDGK